MPPRMKYEMWRQHGPSIMWAGIQVTRAWRCGCWGNVASVSIEKPARGNFLPIVDGGFGLQYSPLMEYREGKGMVLFCQMDVTGRSEPDPAAERLTRNLLSYASTWRAGASRQVVYVGDAAGGKHLKNAGVAPIPYQRGNLSPEQVLVIGASGGRQLAADSAAITPWLKAGGRLLAIGLDDTDAKSMLPSVTMKKVEHIATCFAPFGTRSPLAGIGPADVYNRDPREFSLVSGGATIAGDGVLAVAEEGNAVFCQLAPWQFDYSNGKHSFKNTFRHVSFVLNRLLGNLGVESATPVLARFSAPVAEGKNERRWLEGFYLDQPEDWDDPYRFFRW